MYGKNFALKCLVRKRGGNLKPNMSKRQEKNLASKREREREREEKKREKLA